MSAQDDWKQKYKQLKDDFQSLEKNLLKQKKGTRQQVELLHHVVRQLSLEVRGGDSVLDDKLDLLVASLDTQNPGALKNPVQALDKALRQSQAKRTKSAEEILTAVRRWITELKTLTEHERTHNSLELIKSRSIDAVHHYYELPSILSNIVKLQSEIMDSLLEADSNLLFKSGQTDLDEDSQILLQHIATDLLDLIDGIRLSGCDHQHAKKLLRKLEQGFELPELPALMHQVVKLVAECSRSANDEFEQYLLDISEQLTGMHHNLMRNHQEQQAAGQDQLKVSEQVQKDVTAIQSVAVRSNDLKQLKQIVSKQMAHVHTGVYQLKQAEQQRQREAQHRHDHLTTQLKTVEQEARKTRIKVEEERLRSRIDPLTSLANRTAYNEHIEQELALLRQYNHAFSVAVCDIDHFKQVNDKFGHLAGDKALRILASVFTDGLRSNDFVARYGGEEFIIIMPGTRSQEAARILDKLRAAIAASPFNFKGNPVPITISIGVTEVFATDSPEELFSRADSLLYQAKKSGRNRLCVEHDNPDVPTSTAEAGDHPELI